MARNLVSIPQTLLLLLILFAAGLAVVNAVNIANPQVIARDAHSITHVESSAVVECGNIIGIFLKPDLCKFDYLKRMNDGSICDEVIQPAKRGLLLITAFVYEGKTEADVKNILKAKGCVQIWP